MIIIIPVTMIMIATTTTASYCTVCEAASINDCFFFSFCVVHVLNWLICSNLPRHFFNGFKFWFMWLCFKNHYNWNERQVVCSADLYGSLPWMDHCFGHLKDSGYYCYCTYVLRISRDSDFLSPMLTIPGIFFRGLKLSGESRSQ